MGYQANSGGYVNAPVAGQYVSHPTGEAEVTVPVTHNAVAVTHNAVAVTHTT